MQSYWLKSGVYTTADRMAGVLIGFGGVYILLRGLSKEEFGIWALFLTFASFIEMARSGMIQNGFIRYLTNANNTEQTIITTAALCLNLIISIVHASILYLVAPFLAKAWQYPDVIHILHIYALTTIVLVPLSHSLFILQANFCFKGIFWSNLIRQTLFLGYILIAFSINGDHSLIHLAWAQTAAAAIAALAALNFARKYLSLSKKEPYTWIKILFQYGKFTMGTNLLSMIYKTTDKLMLGFLATSTTVATYDLAIRINNLIEIPAQSMAAIAFPQSAHRNKTQGSHAVKQLYEKSVAMVLLFVLPTILIVEIFPQKIISIIAGQQYLDAAPTLRWMVLYGLFLPFSMQFGTTLDAIGKASLNFAVVSVCLMLSITLNYLFITKMGIMGAVWGTLIAMIVGFVGQQIILYKEINASVVSIAKYIVQYYQLFATKAIVACIQALPKSQTKKKT